MVYHSFSLEKAISYRNPVGSSSAIHIGRNKRPNIVRKHFYLVGKSNRLFPTLAYTK